jgi:hypothetical protein
MISVFVPQYDCLPSACAVVFEYCFWQIRNAFQRTGIPFQESIYQLQRPEIASCALRIFEQKQFPKQSSERGPKSAGVHHWKPLLESLVPLKQSLQLLPSDIMRYLDYGISQILSSNWLRAASQCSKESQAWLYCN